MCTERGGRKGLPAGNKTRCKRTYTAQSKATQHTAGPKKPKLTYGAQSRPKLPQERGPDCCDHVVARRPLQGEAGAGEKVMGFTREDGDPEFATEDGVV
jgi:hypothetical protein